MMLLLLMMYIFAVLGVYLFGKPLRSRRAFPSAHIFETKQFFFIPFDLASPRFPLLRCVRLFTN
jgi:hypothetical protein